MCEDDLFIRKDEKSVQNINNLEENEMHIMSSDVSISEKMYHLHEIIKVLISDGKEWAFYVKLRNTIHQQSSLHKNKLSKMYFIINQYKMQKDASTQVFCNII